MLLLIATGRSSAPIIRPKKQSNNSRLYKLNRLIVKAKGGDESVLKNYAQNIQKVMNEEPTSFTSRKLTKKVEYYQYIIDDI